MREFGTRSNQTRDFGGPRRFSNGPREMHDATCSTCGQSCKVPFRPKEGRPVYCQECFRAQRQQEGGSSEAA